MYSFFMYRLPVSGYIACPKGILVHILWHLFLVSRFLRLFVFLDELISVRALAYDRRGFKGIGLGQSRTVTVTLRARNG